MGIESIEIDAICGLSRNRPTRRHGRVGIVQLLGVAKGMPKSMSSVLLSSNDVAAPKLERHWQTVVVIALVWLAMVALVNPVGDFPLNDDWAYAGSVKELLNTGHLMIPDWAAPNCISQIVWGTVFTKMFGYSYTVLRASTIVLGLFGVLTTYRLIFELGGSAVVATIGALTIAVNPIYFALSNTFMTDVPFFCFSALSLFYLLKALDSTTWRDISLGTLFAGLALLVRQLGFAIPLAFACSYFVGRKLSSRDALKAFFPVIICIFIQISIKLWLNSLEQRPAMYGKQVELVLDASSLPILNLIWTNIKNVVYGSFYVGFFTSPLIIHSILSGSKRVRYYRIIISASLSVLFCVFVAWVNERYLPHIRILPALGNILDELGIGPLLQHGSRGVIIPPYLMNVWRVVGGAAVVFTCILFYMAFRAILCVWWGGKINRTSKIRANLFFAVIMVIYLLPLIILNLMFDRYLLLIFLTVSLFLVSRIVGLSLDAGAGRSGNIQSAMGAVLAYVMIGIIGSASVAMTHDYLSWNRSRWQALNKLVNGEGISPNRIDGGFEFNGSFLFTRDKLDRGPKGWWVTDDEYLIAYQKETLASQEGYSVESDYPVSAWLPTSPQKIFVLHRQ